MLQVHVSALRALVHVTIYTHARHIVQYVRRYICVHSARVYTYYNASCRAYLNSPRRVIISACESLTVLPSRLMNGPVMQRFPAVNSTHDVINHWQVPNTGYHYMYVHMCTFIYVSALKVEHVSSASLHTSFRLIYKNGQTL